MMTLHPTSSSITTGNSTVIVPITATGLLSLLSEPSLELKHYALTQLLSIVDTLWHEIGHALPDLEALSEEEWTISDSSSSLSLKNEIRHLAAAVASKVFFHLEEPFQALRLALESNEAYFHSLLNVSSSSSMANHHTQEDTYVQVLVGAAMEAYISQARKRYYIMESSNSKLSSTDTNTTVPVAVATATGGGGILKNIDATLLESLNSTKLLQLVHVMFQKCFLDLNFKYPLGIAIEARDISLLDMILKQVQDQCCSMEQVSSSSSSLWTLYHVLVYAMNIVTSSTTMDDTMSTTFRHVVLHVVGKHFKAFITSLSYHEKETTRDTMNDEGGTIHTSSNNDEKPQEEVVYPILVTTLEDKKRFSTLRMKCIVSFIQIQQRLKQSSSIASILNQLLLVSSAQEGQDDDDEEEKDLLLALQIGFHLMDSGDQNFVDCIAKELLEPSITLRNYSMYKSRVDKMKRILVGGFSSELSLLFLHKYSDSDRLIMDNVKKTLEERGGSRNSVYHNCAVVTHSYLNAGTTNDSFLRDNLDWMKKASNWYVNFSFISIRKDSNT